jgi:hypothetical protein
MFLLCAEQSENSAVISAQWTHGLFGCVTISGLRIVITFMLLHVYDKLLAATLIMGLSNVYA